MLKKLFTNDKFFLATAICTALTGIVGAILAMISWKFSWSDFLIIVIRVSCGIVLYVAYQKYEKNVLKGMMGALLMIQLIGSILNFSLFNSESYVYVVILFVLTAALFINHFIINSNHHSSPQMILINQILAFLIIFTNVVWVIQDMFMYPDLLNVVTDIFDTLAYSGVLCIIVCVESRLDSYRIDREAAGWTEEAGYPEGYIHQKDK